MATAFVLINTEIDVMEKVLEALKDFKEVDEAYSLYGTFDIIAKVEAESAEKLRDAVFRKIRRLSGVRNTVTLITIEKV